MQFMWQQMILIAISLALSMWQSVVHCAWLCNCVCCAFQDGFACEPRAFISIATRIELFRSLTRPSVHGDKCNWIYAFVLRRVVWMFRWKFRLVCYIYTTYLPWCVSLVLMFLFATHSHTAVNGAGPPENNRLHVNTMCGWYCFDWISKMMSIARGMLMANIQLPTGCYCFLVERGRFLFARTLRSTLAGTHFFTASFAICERSGTISKVIVWINIFCLFDYRRW